MKSIKYLGKPVISEQPFPADFKKSENESRGFSKALPADPMCLLPLVNTDRVLVKQLKETQEVILGCDTQMRYEMINDQNQTIYTVEESSEFFERCWFGILRPMFVHIKDGEGNSIIYLDRPLACQEFCFPYCLQYMAVHCPPGNVIGCIEQKWGTRPILHVKDQTNTVLFIIKGPKWQTSCSCGDIDFPIYTPDGDTICGKVTNQWRGILHQEIFDGDHFGIAFPQGINSQMKVLLMGAAFLTDYMYFESPIQ